MKSFHGGIAASANPCRTEAASPHTLLSVRWRTRESPSAIRMLDRYSHARGYEGTGMYGLSRNSTSSVTAFGERDVLTSIRQVSLPLEPFGRSGQASVKEHVPRSPTLSQETEVNTVTRITDSHAARDIEERTLRVTSRTGGFSCCSGRSKPRPSKGTLVTKTG